MSSSASNGVTGGQPRILTGLNESGRGLTALQNARALSNPILAPRGFGVRSVLCRFPFLLLPRTKVIGHLYLLLALASFALSPVSPMASERLAIVPPNIVLTGPEARQRLLVEKIKDHQFVEQITNQLEFVSSDTSIVRIENDVAVPVNNGTSLV